LPALEKFTDAANALTEVGDLAGVADALYRRAEIGVQTGDYAAASTWCTEALSITELIPNQRIIAQIELLLGVALLGQGEHEQAERWFASALGHVRGPRDSLGEAHVLYGLGMARLRHGSADSAAQLFEDASRLAEQTGDHLLLQRLRDATRASWGDTDGRDGKSDSSPESWFLDGVHAAHWHAQATRELERVSAAGEQPSGHSRDFSR
jgi:tetratricopeptide (TPR) repeat protein